MDTEPQGLLTVEYYRKQIPLLLRLLEKDFALVKQDSSKGLIEVELMLLLDAILAIKTGAIFHRKGVNKENPKYTPNMSLAITEAYKISPKFGRDYEVAQAIWFDWKYICGEVPFRRWYVDALEKIYERALKILEKEKDVQMIGKALRTLIAGIGIVFLLYVALALLIPRL